MKQEYQEIKSQLLTVINLCAPDGNVQREFVNVLHEMELSGESPHHVIKTLVGRLYDGLAYGNWPGKPLVEPRTSAGSLD